MANFIPVTRTKIMVPRRRPEILSRTRLLELLDELLDNRLIIVAAPAGYGKTSLLVDFANSTQWPFCWYALDTLDNDPQRFVAHFISALSLRFPNFGKSCMAALQSMSQDQLDLDVLVSMIVNDAYESITEHFIMVLDDFHLVEHSRPVVYFVNRFIQDVDENCHLVLASRSLLTLPDLTLMVARAQVGGLSYEELGFQPAEIQGLLQQNFQLAVSDAEAEELAQASEGWVTGLLLSSQLKGKTVTNRLRVARVSGVGLYEYLAQQVLELQSAELQEFMLRTSLIDEFDITLCKSVLGKALLIDPDWRALMDAVLRLNLFVLPVGEDGQFIRYHHLLKDFLRERIRRERPDEARQIQLRMAEIYAEREDWERAYQYYQMIGETSAVVGLLEKAGSSMITNGQIVTLAGWLESFADDLLGKHPALLSLQGTVEFMRGDCHAGLRYLDMAVSGLWPGGDPLQLAQTLCRRSAAYRFLGQYRDAANDADEAINLLEDQNQNSIIYADALLAKGTVLYYLGQLGDALAMLQSSLQAYQTLNDRFTIAKVWMEIGSVLKKMGKYTEAEEAYKRSLSHYQETNNYFWQANLYNNLGVLQHASGDYVAATASFDRAIHYAKVSGSPRLEAYALSSIGDLYQELEAIQETLEAYRQAREVAQRVQDGYLLFYLNLVEARLKLTMQDDSSASMYLYQAEEMADTRGSQYEQNICRIEWGRIKLANQDFSNATLDFHAALSYFIEKGYELEIPRARLYAYIAAALSGEQQLRERLAAHIRECLSDDEKRKLLVAAGREAVHYLEQLARDKEHRLVIPPILSQVEKQNQSIPGLRRTIRRHAGVVPFAPPKMIVRTLGRIQVKVSDQIVTSSDWQVQTARDLFLLLMAHPEGLTKEEIGEIFWPDSTPGELKLRFKNTIYRLRHAAGKDVILFEGESRYLFNRGIDYEYDAEAFLKEIAAAEKAGSSEKREGHYQNALRLYRGPYLPGVDEEWAIIERERLNQMVIDALLKLANMAIGSHNYEHAIEYCQQALQQDNCQEDAHRLAMRVYAAMGKRALVIRQFEQCRQALLTEVDAPPSYQTQALYESLIQ